MSSRDLRTRPRFRSSPQDVIGVHAEDVESARRAGSRLRVAGATPAVPEAAGAPFPNPAMMFAALDPNEIERKINELRIVENWLSMTLNMMQMSIKTLELQKASVEAFSAAQQAMQGHGGPAKPKQGK